MTEEFLTGREIDEWNERRRHALLQASARILAAHIVVDERFLALRIREAISEAEAILREIELMEATNGK